MKRLKFFLGFSFGCFILILVFQKNLLSVMRPAFFNEFQADSEALVVGSIMARKYNVPRNQNLGWLMVDGKAVVDSREAVTITERPGLGFSGYGSSYGIQGPLYYKIAEFSGFGSLSRLQYFSSAALAFIVLWLFLLYRKIYDKRFAAMFLASIVASPWLVSFARNLYWSPFLWFLPALFAAILYTKKSKPHRMFWLFSVAFAMFIKCLAGYEYITSITLLACSVFIAAPFFGKESSGQRPDLKMATLVFAACVIGFLLALLMHANVRGDSIIEGLLNIYEQDVKRRTYGDPSGFAPVYKASLLASPFDIVQTYFYDWGTISFLAPLPGRLLKTLFYISLAGLACKFFTKHPSFKRDLVVFCYFLTIPISWFVLAKAHSFIHTHLNYVLWYLGFASALLYVAMNSVVVIYFEATRWLKSLEVKDY